ncbi:MAG: hypothetical protein FJ033_00585 [Chloroflexi bacterium]|nr:hypothetical protein [Chloroflexota bacterium]
MSAVLALVLPGAAAFVCLLFAALVFEQFRLRRRAFQVLWALGLLWYGIGAGTEFVGAAFGWSEPIYRLWYLFGAILTAAYLGAGTVTLLARTGFGYIAALGLIVGGLFALLSQQRLVREGTPADSAAVYGTLMLAVAAGEVLIYVTLRHRHLVGHVTIGILAAATFVAAWMALTAPVAPPGYALDPYHVPVGSAFDPNVRVLTGPFNIAGALCLVGGAIYSAYVYMPKRKILRARRLPPIAAQVYGFATVLVNLVASIPSAWGAARAGAVHSRVPATLLIAVGGFIPSITSGLNRFGLTWGFFLGELLGVLFIFAGFLVSEEVFRDRRVSLGSLVLWRGSGSLGAPSAPRH